MMSLFFFILGLLRDFLVSLTLSIIELVQAIKVYRHPVSTLDLKFTSKWSYAPTDWEKQYKN